MTRRTWTAAAAALVALAGCGSDSSDAPATKAGWLKEYGAKVTAVGTALDKVGVATKGGEPVAIRTSCEGLRDTNQEAKALPAVPDASAAGALTEALDAVTTGAADCNRAIAMNDARLLEKAIAELRDARIKLDTANARLNP